MRVEAYTVLHYGKSYLSQALHSIYNHVDRIHVVYSPAPSHGSMGSFACPETEDELRQIAHSVGPKVNWRRETGFRWEGQHRDFALGLCDGADLALVVDADEVWEPSVLEKALQHAWDNSARTWRVNFTTPWRSFTWVCRDGMWPERIKDNRSNRDQSDGYIPKELGDIWHFGYAIPTSALIYKISIHGHVGEWRKGWLEEKWQPWPPVDDVHPTCDNTWHPQQMEREKLPEIMRQHPYWNVVPVP